MGVDSLDMGFRIEQAFQFKWEGTDYDRLFAYIPDPANRDLRAGDVHHYVCTRLRELGRAIPHSSWHRVQKVLAETTGTSPKLIRPQSFLKKDLGFCG